MKDQRTWAEVCLKSLAHNISEIKKLTKTEVMAIIKADGYGHGAVQIADTLLNNGADCLGIATVDEGLELRRAGITKDILVLSLTSELRFREVLSHNLLQTVAGFEMAKKLSDVAVEMGITARIHIKIDTGMGRVGLRPNDCSIDEILKIKDLDRISVEGIYTHLAASDAQDKSFTYEQHKKFLHILSGLKAKGFTGYKEHICNSAGTLSFPELYMDMVRPGLMLYGAYPSEHVTKSIELKPVIGFKTRVTYVKYLEEGESVGYSRTYFVKRKTLVATLPVGYADGYSRGLSNKGRVIVNGQFAPVIGRVCMDQMMIDITDIDGVNVGDEVVLMGTQKEKTISADEIASLRDTITWEVFCNIGKRVPRIYK